MVTLLWIIGGIAVLAALIWGTAGILLLLSGTCTVLGRIEDRTFVLEKRLLTWLKKTFLYGLFKSRIDFRENFIDENLPSAQKRLQLKP